VEVVTETVEVANVLSGTNGYARIVGSGHFSDPVAAVVLGMIRETGRQGGENGMTMQIPVVHEHQKESSNSLLFSNPPRETFQQTADIDAHVGVPSTPSTMERIMLQPSSGPDYLGLFSPVSSWEP
jgi:hypothetical protein